MSEAGTGSEAGSCAYCGQIHSAAGSRTESETEDYNVDTDGDVTDWDSPLPPGSPGPGPGQVGIVWGGKLVAIVPAPVVQVSSRMTQTEEDKATQTGEADRQHAPYCAKFHGNVHAMNIPRRKPHARDMPVHQVRVHHLGKGENKSSVLYRLEKGWILRFLLSPNLYSSTVRLFCNHPPQEGAPFDRATYHELEWKRPTGMRSDLTDVYADIRMTTSGSFNYFFTIDESTCQKNANGQGYFLVDPMLHLGGGQTEITMDCIQMQTVITKLLGPFDQWEKRLMVARETGYNMIHFTPVQELGISNSAYSIRDQLRLSPVYSPDERVLHSLSDLQALVNKMDKEWNVLSLTDLVFNHTSKDSPWILQHPECAYNLKNAPHLRPAYLMDRILANFNKEVSSGRWEPLGLPAEVVNEGHLECIRNILHQHVLPQYNLQEFYIIDVEQVMKEFKRAINENRPPTDKTGEVVIVQDPQYRRLQSSINMDLALKNYNTDRPNVFRREDRISQCCEALKERLEFLNSEKEKQVADHIATAINNFVANARYRFVTHDGPHIGTVTEDEPLMHEYFVVPPSHLGSVEKEEQMMDSDPEHIMAVNGWVMGDDPLRNFAEAQSNVYLRRELIAWGDSVKLRYGQKPEDCQYLWDHMRKYAESTAKIFHGIRLDNCHSTPIHVAEYMLDCCRKVRPDLYVVAELFTGSEALDNLFMNRLGINSLIREALNAWDAHEEGRLVYRFGGLPVGAFAQPRVRPLVPTVAHALFYDQTHDNPSPVEKRSVFDLWPSAALVSMANCACGSNRGYDELVPHHIHVVNEKRPYATWCKDLSGGGCDSVNLTCGIMMGKRLLNQLHFEMAMGGYREVFVDQLDPDVVSVMRHNPQTHESIVLVARTAFIHPWDINDQRTFRPVFVQGNVEEVLFEGSMRSKPEFQYSFCDTCVNGLNGYCLEVREHISMSQSNYATDKGLNEMTTEVSFRNFTPGTVVCFRCSLRDSAKEAILEIRRGLGQFGYMMRSYSGNTTFDDTWDTSNYRAIVSRLTLGDLNRVMYRVDQEEKDDNFGFSTYHIPNHGNLCYSGLRGVMSVLGEMRPSNELGHPMCNNLREGNWLMDYIANRLKVIGNTFHLGQWFENMFGHLKKIPRFLIPCYFDAIVTGAYIVLREMALQQFSDFVKDGSTFVQALSLGSIQFLGHVRSAKLPRLSPNLTPPPRVEIVMATSEEEPSPVSMAAGLPHFASGFWRCWGRDTFIALRGMMLVTGRYEDARFLILAFASTLRHGLIPNLLFEGKRARYNCRDAVWWWLQAIQQYTIMAPQGEGILKDPVMRMYPTDDSPPLEMGGCEQKLCDVMQEALERHMVGVKFRERDAGKQLDDHMNDEGFNVEIGVRWPQGYVFGGNVHNCGTWMDKMGSSSKAGNLGKPATPRDGSAVELVGLCASTVRWLAQLSKKGVYPYEGVCKVQGDYTDGFVSFEQWHSAIMQYFERDFYISPIPNPENEPNPELINRRGMYKDSFYATQFWANFQLRPNFCVAMVVAPELFTPENAWTALNLAQEVLLGPLGMKTLDPADWAYRGDYCVSNDSCDPTVAHGFNYHNGPEWVWPLAYFLRAKLYFATKIDHLQKGTLRDTVDFVNNVLCRHYQELMHSPWKSLPELTNHDGSYCADSCRAQAWSDGCVLEVLYDLERIECAERPSLLNLQA